MNEPQRPAASARTWTSERVDAKASARREFDSWASSYDRSLLHFFLFRPCYAAMLREILLWFREHGTARGTEAKARLLDVGCGTANFARHVMDAGLPIELVGMDYSPAMCAVAAGKLRRRERASPPGILAGDSEHLPFGDGSVDLITCANSFHHYPRQAAVVREMRRVLRPGGRLILLDGFRDNAVGWFVFEVVVARIEKDVHHATWREMHSHFVDAGLGNIRRWKFNFLFPVLVTTGDAPS